jgi:hypothetical protein
VDPNNCISENRKHAIIKATTKDNSSWSSFKPQFHARQWGPRNIQVTAEGMASNGHIPR